MKTSTYVTFDEIKPNNGAGVVCEREIQNLASVTLLKQILCRKEAESFTPGVKVTRVDVREWYDFNPFLADYFAAQAVTEQTDFLHISGAPGWAIVKAVKPSKYVVNIVAHDLALSIDEFKRMYGDYPFKHLTDDYLRWVLHRHCEEADCILCPSTPAANWIGNNLKVKRVEIIPHGVHHPCVAYPLADGFRVGYLGAFGPDKGLIYLMMAWSRFTGPGELVFGGSCGQYIEPYASSIMGKNVRYRATGWVDNVSEFYRSLRVYVQPSVTEGFGIEVVEAMAHGLPVIATTGTCAVDVIKDGVTGFIVPPRDPKAILDKLLLLQNDPELAVRMGKAASDAALAYAWPEIDAKYQAFYNNLIYGRPMPAPTSPAAMGIVIEAARTALKTTPPVRNPILLGKATPIPKPPPKQVKAKKAAPKKKGSKK